MVSRAIVEVKGGSAAAETALLVGLVAINAAPFSVMHGAVQFLVHGS
jgi:hypothetical protein